MTQIGEHVLSQDVLIGYFNTLDGSSVSWKTKKQTIVSCSSAEAEYRAMATVTSELIWIRSFLASLRVFVKLPTKLFCDNQAALHIAKESCLPQKD